MTRRELLNQIQARLEVAHKPALEARWLLAHGLGIESRQLLTELETEVPADGQMGVLSNLERRLAGYPLQLIVGETEFFGLPFKVAEGVLIPRPETEGLVEIGLKLIEALPSPRVLDVGTGSGVIAVAIKHHRPDAVVWASDVDENALALARQNASELNCEVGFLAQGFTANLNHLDLIISNPPYLPEPYKAQAPPELSYENPQALYSGLEGLDMPRQLLVDAGQALKAGGWLALELGPDNVQVLARQARRAGWTKVEVKADLAGRDRYLIGSRAVG